MDSVLGYRPFTLQWLNSVFQETLLPGSPWIQVRDAISRSLQGTLEPELTNPERRQMVFILLGHRFVADYFEQYEFQPRLLDSLRSEEKKKLQQDVQLMLKDKIRKAVEECGYSHSPVEDPDGTPDDLVQYWQHTRQLLEKGWQRHVLHEEDKSPHNTWQQIEGVAEVITKNPAEPPNCWSHMSDTLGQSILAILKRAPHRLQNVCSRLLGRQLPASLRRYIWTNCILRSHSLSSTSFRTHEKAVRNKYGKSVSKGKQQLKIQNATETPVNQLIIKSIVEVMKVTPSMQSYQTLSLREHIRKTINIMFTYNQVFEPYLIHWLFPLLLAYREDSDAAEFSYEIAMYIEQLQHGMYPTWPQVFSVAEGALRRLEKIDINFYSHLQQGCSKEFMLDVKDYMVEILMKEQRRSHVSGSSDGTSPSTSAIDLSSPVMLARKWVGEGFVGVLDAQAVLFVWDQCFMQQWDHQVLQDVCLLLLLLLKYDFMLANNYNEVKQVFTCSPAKLYTVDIVRGYQHLIRGDDPKQIPDLNRHWHSVTKPSSPEEVEEEEEEEVEEEEEELQMSPEPVEEEEEEEEKEQKLTAVGLKYFRLKLIMKQSIPKGRLPQKHLKALLDFQAGNLSLTVSFFVGDEMICSKSLTKTARLIKEEMLFASLESQRKRGKIDTKVYLVQMAKESLVFDVDEDLQNQGIATKDEEPYVIINISYRMPINGDDEDGISIPLGWARVKLYNLSPQETDNLSNQPGTSEQVDTTSHEGRRPVKLSVLSGEQTVPLYPGNPNLKVNSSEDGEEDNRNLLKEGSELILDVFEVIMEDDLSQRPLADQSASVHSDSEDGLDPPWVSQIESAMLSPVDVELKDTFDLYIDAIRFLPDNASFTKVIGQVVSPYLNQIPEFQGFPVLDSSARCPQISQRVVLSGPFKQRNIVVLSLYTVDRDTHEVVAVGSGSVPLFHPHGEKVKLNVGGHQLRVISSLPDPDKLSYEPNLNDSTIVPGCAILVRILPHTKDPIPAPDYYSRTYASDECKPSSSELRVLRQFQKGQLFPAIVRDSVEALQESEAVASPGDDKKLATWLTDRLKIAKHIPRGSLPMLLDLTRCVRYSQKTGLTVAMKAAYNINADGVYTQCYGQVIPGDRTNDDASNSTTNEKFVTKDIDMNSLQCSPSWQDQPKVLHPSFDENTVLLIKLVTMDAKYIPRNDGKGSHPGTLQDVRVSCIGWTVLQLFDRDCTFAGDHMLPIFKEPLSDIFLKEIRSKPLDAGLKSALKKNTIQFNQQYSSMLVEVRDGHFVKDDTVVIMKKRDDYLRLGPYNKFNEAAETRAGEPVSKLLLGSLPSADEKKGVDGKAYKKEVKMYRQAMVKAFSDYIDK